MGANQIYCGCRETMASISSITVTYESQHLLFIRVYFVLNYQQMKKPHSLHCGTGTVGLVLGERRKRSSRNQNGTYDHSLIRNSNTQLSIVGTCRISAIFSSTQFMNSNLIRPSRKHSQGCRSNYRRYIRGIKRAFILGMKC